MTNQYSIFKMLLTLLLGLFLVAACQATGDGPGVDSRSPGTEATIGSEEVEPVQVEVVIGPGTFFLPDPQTGLAELSSYKATLTVTFDGAEVGQPQLWSSTYVMLYAKEPAASLLTIENSGDQSAADPAFLAEVDGAAYEISEDGACNVSTIDPENSLLEWLEPAGLLSSLSGAEEAGQETVNGVAGDHYTFDERALTQFGAAESTGEIWVASDGGYILKYLVTTTGGAGYFGEGIEGTITWDYELTDINLPSALDLPANCSDGMVNAPRLPDASNLVNLRGWLGYDTSVSVTESAAFYLEHLPGLGWAQSLQSLIVETNAFLEFTQGDQKMSLVITPSEAGTRVDIFLTSPLPEE